MALDKKYTDQFGMFSMDEAIERCIEISKGVVEEKVDRDSFLANETVCHNSLKRRIDIAKDKLISASEGLVIKGSHPDIYVKYFLKRVIFHSKTPGKP